MDWSAALSLAIHRRDSERDRLDRIESKIAPIIAGTLAGLGLFIDKAATPVDYFVGALLLVPLGMLLNAFRTYVYIDVPNLDELVAKYEWYPQTYVKSVVLGIADAVAKNAPVIDSKARQLNRAMGVLFAVVVIIIAWRTYEAVTLERTKTASQPAPTATSRSAPPTAGAAAATHGGQRSNAHPKAGGPSRAPARP